MNDAQTRDQFELESVKAKGQSLPNGFQSSFFEAPELEKSLVTCLTAVPFNSFGLCFRKKQMSEFCRLQLPRLIFNVDTDPMCRRLGPDKTETAGGETKPNIRKIGKVGTPFFCSAKSDLR